MKTKMTRTQGALLITAALAIMFFGLFLFSNNANIKKLRNEKIRSEALLSEKLNLEKDSDILQKEMMQLKEKLTALDQKIEASAKLLSSKENEIRKLTAERASASELKKKYEELEALRDQLEKEISSLESNIQSLLAEQRQSQDELEAMKLSNDLLSKRNFMLEAMLSDNFQSEALKGKNEKITVSARRANTLVASFDVPTGMGEAIHFRVITPEDEQVSSLDSPLASTRVKDYDENLLASLSGSGMPANDTFSKRAELIYKPDQKLTKGIYKFHVYDGDMYVGSVQLRLR